VAGKVVVEKEWRRASWPHRPLLANHQTFVQAAKGEKNPEKFSIGRIV